MGGRNAIVTGGSRNLGREFCLALAEAGADLAIIDLPTQEKEAHAVVQEAEALGRRALFVPLDLRDADAIEPCVGDITVRLGPVHVLVNNAGRMDDVSAGSLDYRVDILDQHYQVNVRGTFLMSRAVARHMIEGGVAGSIVNIASRVGVHIQPSNPGYSITKAAVVHMTRVMAMEFKRHGIRVNALAPGRMRPFEEETLPILRSPKPGTFLHGLPLAYSDIAGAIVYLASDAASMVTAQVLVIDGGMGLVSAY